MAPSTFDSVRQLLVHPKAYFERRNPAWTLSIAFGLVVCLAIATALSTFLVGSMLAGAVDATVTMDNPQRPPDWMCEEDTTDLEATPPAGCDQPKTIERDAGALIYDATTDYAPLLLFAPFVMWIIGGITLNVAGRVAGGSPTFSGTFALAGWAALPELFRLAVGLVALGYALAGMTITHVEQAQSAIETATASVSPILSLATLVAVGWQWYLLSGGLAVDADIDRRTAAVVVGVPLGIWLLFALT